MSKSVYENYTVQSVKDADDVTFILFVFAPWCNTSIENQYILIFLLRRVTVRVSFYYYSSCTMFTHFLEPKIT